MNVPIVIYKVKVIISFFSLRNTSHLPTSPLSHLVNSFPSRLSYLVTSLPSHLSHLATSLPSNFSHIATSSPSHISHLPISPLSHQQVKHSKITTLGLLSHPLPPPILTLFLTKG